MAIIIKGLTELTAKIEMTKKTIPDKLDLAMNDTADAILLEALRLVPVASSILKQSIKHDLSERLRKVIFASADYASKIEFGEPIGGNPKTHNHPKRATPPGPRPFMRPAFDTQSKRLKEFYDRRK
tara:strand:- start:172 stop:549 length:378 start_codon:yes stop_codon:yes gene_type:complete